MYKEANAGHVGCSLSCLEIITFIKFQLMKDQDELILSKGHAAALLYSVLAEDGIISEKEIETFYKNGTYLSAHPPVNKIKGVPFATGSLGHGLSLAAGFGLANKLKRQDKLIFCITSDGELNEGSTWEAALFISHHNLKNIFWFIDRNYIQGFGRTEDIPLGYNYSASFGYDNWVGRGRAYTALEGQKFWFLGKNLISANAAFGSLIILLNLLLANFEVKRFLNSFAFARLPSF